MADRRTHDSSFGHPGRLAYSTYGTPQAQGGGWLSARNHDHNVPKFNVVSPRREWFEASRIPFASSTPARDSWQSKQRQSVWLLKNHPAAALGNDVLGEVLSVANSPSLEAQEQTAFQGPTQLAVGEMNDMSNAQRTSSVPLLAMAAGSTGDVLRLVRPQVEDWQLGNDDGAIMRLVSCVDHQETLWMNDIGTIRRVKFLVNSKRFEPLRWLLVQRDTGTTVFQPEYQKVPIFSNSLAGNGPGEPSHISPNPLFTISKRYTGCDLHTDAAFNPATRSMPPQLAIVDEGGNWTIWDIARTRSKTYNRPKLSLSKFGSLQKGIRKKLPRKTALNPRWHKILWIGTSTSFADGFDDSDEDDCAGITPKSAFPSLERSSILLLCNANTIRLLDLEFDAFLPDLGISTEGNKEEILDVHVNTQDPRYFFALTTSRLFVAAVFTTRNPMQNTEEKRGMILHSSPHMRGRLGTCLKLAVTPGPRSPNVRTSLVFLYSDASSWVDVFCVRMSKKQPDRVTCYHDTMILGGNRNKGADISLQTICLSPAVVTCGISVDKGRLYTDQGTRYYQVFSLGTDLSLACSLGATSCSGLSQTLSPSRKVVQEVSKEKERKGKERLGMLRYLGSRFVVSDTIAELHDGNDVIPARRDHFLGRRLGQPLRRFVGPLYVHIQGISWEMQGIKDGQPMDMQIFGSAPFDPVYVAVESALETGALALKTMCETIPDLRVPQDMGELSDDWQEEVHQLQRVDPAFRVMSLTDPRSMLQEQPSLVYIFTRLQALAEIGHAGFVSDAHEELAAATIREIACQLYLSQFGIMHWQSSLFDYQAPENRDIRSPSNFTEDMTIDSQASRASSSFRDDICGDIQANSRSSTPVSTISGVATSETTEDAEDRSATILRAYTGSGQLLPQKKLEIISMWKEGEDLDKYVFSIDKVTEITEGMQRRARQDKKEALKRKRRETIQRRLQEREQSVRHSTQPPLETRSHSQASLLVNENSQKRAPFLAPTAMSQPVAGAFGNRSNFDHPKKRVKRRGGF